MGRPMSRSFPVAPLPRVRWADSDARSAKIATAAPRIPWDKFSREYFRPVPGEHVAIVGPTGQGKTVLQNNILPKFPFVAVFATKPADRSMVDLINRQGYIRLARWNILPGVNLNPIDNPRRVLWPDATTIDSVDRQKKVFHEAFEKIFREGGKPAASPVGWAIAIDELWYFVNVLGLGMDVKMILLQGRSLGISLIAATQRPKFVPLEVYDQATHLFFFRDNDRNNQQRLSEINARDSGLIKDLVANLDMHQVLYINTRTGKMARTRAPKPEG